MAIKKAVPKRKKPTQAAIKLALQNLKGVISVSNPLGNSAPTTVNNLKKELVSLGYEPKVTAKQRDAALAKVDSNHKTTPRKMPQRTNKGGPGGKRPGAGRKHGATTKKTKEIADKLAADGEITPLEYMLGVMRETPEKIKAQYDNGEIDAVEYAVKMTELIKRRDNAAEKAAPFIHPRLASIEAKVEDSGHEKWLALMEGLAEAS